MSDSRIKSSMSKAFFLAVLFSTAAIRAGSPQLSEKWHFAAKGAILSSPAIGPAGTVYFGSYDHNLYAVNPDGSEKWRYATGDIITGSPCIDQDGNIYIGSQDAYFYSIRPDGTLNWRKKLGSPLFQSGAVGPGPVIYVSADRLYALDSAGQTIWTSDAACNTNASPVVGHDGTVYTASSRISAVTPKGALKWTYPFTGSASYNEAGCTPAVGPDGMLYAGSKDGHLYAINPDGTQKWSCNTGNWVLTSPILLADGKIFFCSNDFNLYVLSPGGEVLNSRALGSWAPAVIGAAKDGLIYASVGRSLMAVDIYRGALAQIEIHFNDSSYPTIAPDGTIYVGTSGGASGSGPDSESYLFAITSNNGGLGDTHWPKCRGDARNTGSAFDPQAPAASVSKSAITSSAGETVVLDGSLSTSPSGRPLSYQWKCTLAPSSVPPAISDAKKAMAKVVTNDLGKYQFQLQVDDGVHPVSIAAVTINCGYIELDIPGFINGSPAIGDSGIVYAGSTDNCLLAFDADGTEKWRFQTGRSVMTPAIGPDGTVYFSSADLTFYAVHPDGSEKWRYIGRTGFLNPPAVDVGVIYIIDGADLVALDADGSELWRYRPEPVDYPGPASIGSDGTVYFCTNDGYIHAVRPDGKIKWRSSQGRAFDRRTELAIGPGDRLYFTGGGKLHVVNPDGSIAWDSPEGQYFSYANPVIDSTGVIYANSYTHFNAFYPDGKIKWQYPIGKNESDGYQSLYAIGSDGQIFMVTAFDQALFMFGGDGSLNRKFTPLGMYVSAAPAIDPHGRVYVDTGYFSKDLIGVQTETPGPASRFWPKSRHDNRNTASVHNLSAPCAATKGDTIHANLNQTVVLDGSSSYDPDKDPLTFLWRCIRKPENSRYALTDSTAPRASVQIFDPGIYTFSVTVADPNDGTSVAFMTVQSGLGWKRFIQNNLTQAAIGADGTLYLGYQAGIAAVNPDGSEKWRYPVYSGEPNTPAIDSSGTVYFACNMELLALTPSGEKKWGINAGFMESSSPSIGKGRTVYVCLKYDRVLLAVDSDGKTKWRFTAGGSILSSPAIDQKGIVYFGCLDNKLYAVNPDGTEKWSFAANDIFDNSPCISCDGTVYIGSNDKCFYAVNPDGTKKWVIETEAPVYGSPVIGYDETVYFTTSEGKLYAVQHDGKVKWTFNLAGYYLRNSALVGADSTVYITDEKGRLYALAPDGGVKWTYQLDPQTTGSLSLNKDGILYCSMPSGHLYAVQTSSAGLAATSWPKFKHDYRNSGWIGPAQTAVGTSGKVEGGLPSAFGLLQNYPNPFNSGTTITIELPRPGRIRLYVYDILGRKAAVLADADFKAGVHRLWFDASGLKTGIYFYRIETPQFMAVKKMIVIE